MSDWYDIRRQARRDVHAAFAVAVEYIDHTMSDPVALGARWQQRFGAAIGAVNRDAASLFETIDRVVFNKDELDEKGVTLRRGGQVVFIKYEQTVRLDVREPSGAPVEETWTVST